MSYHTDSDTNYDSYGEETDYEMYVNPNHEEIYPASEKAEILKELREDLDWEDEDDRLDFLGDLGSELNFWKKEFPDLRPIFSPEEIDLLLSDAVKRSPGDRRYFDEEKFIKFVFHSGYKDGLAVSSERRTTALHRAARLKRVAYIPYLFRIYNSFDVDYTDESGLTHFHVACMTKGCREAVGKFLERGKVDLDLVWPETGDTPLHLALKHERSNEVLAMLVRAGADRGLANREGLTPLHAIMRMNRFWVYNVAKNFFGAASTEGQVWVDAKDASGDTALHSVLQSYEYPDVKKLAELILRNGADPNLANEEGSTPLHLICKRDQDRIRYRGVYNRHEYAEMLFNVAEEKNRPVRVDAKDKSGRTPLQCAVVKSLVHLVDVLLKRGADISNFVYPTVDQFDELLAKERDEWELLGFQFELVTGLLYIAKHLEDRGGFRLGRSDASTIMRLIARHGVFDMRDDRERRWGADDEFDDGKIFEEAKAKVIGATTIHDLVLMPAGRRADELVTCRDFYDFARDETWGPDECTGHLCEMAARGFFRRWALDPFWELISHRLPLICCAMIIDNLKNEDLYHICLAATDQSS